jgi:hypothetical protein
MQYKSARPCFNISSKFFLGAVAFGVSLFALNQAEATMTVTSFSTATNYIGTTLANSANSIFYYPVYVDLAMNNSLQNPPTGIAQIGVLDPTFSFLDLGQDPDPTGSMQQAGVIVFNVSSTATASSQAVLVAQIVNTTGTPATAIVPIIGIGTGGGLPPGCGSNNSLCIYSGQSNSKTGHAFYDAVYINPNTTYQVAISPTAFCESLFQNGTTDNTFCTNGFFENGQPVSGSETMNFTFAVYPYSSFTTVITGGTTVPASPTDSIDVNMNLESLNPTPVTSAAPSPVGSPSPSPTLICNLSEGVYTPVQNGFELPNPAANFSVVNDPSGPTVGLNQLIAVAIPSPGPLNATVNNYRNPNANTVILPFPFTPNYVVGGFTNSTAANPVYYDLGFLAEDAAGFVIDDGSGGTNPTCVFPGVFSTSAVQGFLSQSKCFIATAAFRDLNSAPLVLLRSFRDQFLEHFSLGRNFVHWYYAWSPDAAEWLIDHPIFRFPVLLALIPLQCFAWLILHPFLMLVLIFIAASIVAWGALLRRATE